MKNRIKNIASFITSLIIVIVLQSCFLLQHNKSEKSQSVIDTHEQEGFVKATIKNYNLDGCMYLIQLEDGKKLEPINLQEEYKKDNFKVWIKYQHYKGNSVCMAGEMVTLTAIEKML